MNPVPHARTYARTEMGSETPRGGGTRYLVSPNRRGKARQDQNRGALRIGIVEQNESTEADGIAGFLAAVTREEHGEVWFYIFTSTPEGVVLLNGPHWALSEEIVPMESAR